MVPGGSSRRARWSSGASGGAGKTLFFEHLFADLDAHAHGRNRAVLGGLAEAAPKQVATIRSDLWAEATEPDLHFALFENFLSNSIVLREHAWGLAYPVMLGPMLLFRGLSQLLRGGELKIRDVSMRLQMPPMHWQSALERMVSTMRRKGILIVWLLDEIDRGTPESVQAGLALERRALSLPGVTTVIPFVPDQLQYKFACPAVLAKPDVGSTILATIYAELLDHADQDGTSIGTLLGERGFERADVRPPDRRGRPSRPEDAPLEHDPLLYATRTMRADFVRALVRWYEQKDRWVQQRIEKRAMDKHLGSHVMELPEPGPRDLADLLWCVPEFRRLPCCQDDGRGAYTLREPLIEGTGLNLRDELQEEWQQLLAEDESIGMPPIRALLRHMTENISHCQSLHPAAGGARNEQHFMVDVVTAIVTAFRRAAIVYATRGGKA